jgi:hypothetical protein
MSIVFVPGNALPVRCIARFVTLTTEQQEAAMRVGLLVCTIALGCIVLVAETSLPAVNRCTVRESKANTLVLECEHDTEPFAEGTQVKIKTDRERNGRKPHR